MKEQTAESARELSYENAILKSSGFGSEVTVKGRMIARPAAGIAGPRGCIPILWCLCVHDSPDSPCPCDGPIIWIPEISIRNRRRAKHREDGVLELDLSGKTKVFVEDTQEADGTGTRVLRKTGEGAFEPIEEAVWVQEFTPMRVDRLKRALEVIESDPKLSVMAKKKGKGFWGKIVAAFEAGWAIGEFIDEETGLSDKISDWLLDTFGPWPW